jgi:beta-glucosidase
MAAKASAVLIGLLPGNRAGEAIADILFGASNPSGRLPITFPRNPNGITTYDCLPLEAFDGNSYDFLYPFGHGLSYTQFTYSNLKLSTNSLIAPDTLKVEVTVQNTGRMDGKEVVLLYLNDEIASVPRPLRQLKKFKKIDLKMGESRKVSFELDMYDLSFIGLNSERIYEEGEFNIYVDKLKATFSLIVNNTYFINDVDYLAATFILFK